MSKEIILKLKSKEQLEEMGYFIGEGTFRSSTKAGKHRYEEDMPWVSYNIGKDLKYVSVSGSDPYDFKFVDAKGFERTLSERFFEEIPNMDDLKTESIVNEHALSFDLDEDEEYRDYVATYNAVTKRFKFECDLKKLNRSKARILANWIIECCDLGK